MKKTIFRSMARMG